MHDTEVKSTISNTKSQSLTVLHVGPGFGQRGGVASVLGELALSKPEFDQEGIIFRFFETRGFKKSKDFLLFGFVDIPRFFVSLCTKVDIVHFHVSANGSFYRKFVLYLIARTLKKRTLFHWHANNLESFCANAGPAVAFAVSKFIKGADAAIGVSTEMSRDLIKLKGGSDGIYTIGNSAYEAEVAAGSLSESPKMLQGVQPYLAFAARFVPEKGIADLLAAIALLKSEGRYIELRLAGTGDTRVWKEMIANLQIGDRVRFVGWLSGMNKLHFYHNALAFCLPSHREPFGIVTLEAMYCASPIVGTTRGGFLDLVENGVTGLLVEPKDPKGLAACIRVLLDDPDRAHRMGLCGLERARRLYSTRAVVGQYIQCYREIITGTVKSP